MARYHFPPTASRQPELVELRLISRSDQRQCLALPCGATDRVDLDGLNERERNYYLYARAVTGRTSPFRSWRCAGCADTAHALDILSQDKMHALLVPERLT